MNATTKQESTALTIPERAAVALGAPEHEVKLRELVKASAGILSLTNKAGRDECHSAYMTLKNTRVAINHKVEEVTEDAKAFTKGVKAEAARLLTISLAEEDRLQKLRDEWDEAERARKDALIAAERLRVETIQRAIQAIREMPLQAVGKSSSEISAIIGALVGAEPGESFEEFIEEAMQARSEALGKLAAAETAQRAVEIEAEERRQAEARAAAEAEEARQVEAARLAAEKAELARQRAENERVAAEQAAESKRLAEAAAAERAAQAKAAAEAQVKLDAQAAALAEQQRKLAEQQAAADARDAAAAAAREQEERDRLAQEEIAHTPAPEPVIESQPAPIILDPDADCPAPTAPAQSELVTLADDQDDSPFPADAELVAEIRAMLAETFGMNQDEADSRMMAFDYSQALAEIVP